MCQDTRTSLEEVSCAEPHTGEYVRPRYATDMAPVDCLAMAERYMDVAYGRVADRLNVLTIRKATGPQCVVEARGANLLTASIRDLRVSAIPLEAQ